MIDHWLSEDGKDAITQMGWAYDGPYLFAVIDGEQYPVAVSGRAGAAGCQPALALLRDHAREWLAESDVFAIGRKYPERGLRWWVLTPDDALWRPETMHSDYDAALIAAILATEETT